MAIAFRNLTQGGASAATSAVATPPSGLANDDILLFWIYKENNNAITWPTGFVQLAARPASNSSFTEYVAWKRASSESGNYTASWTGSVWRNWVMEARSGATTSGSPEDVTTASQANGSGTANTCPSLTTATAGAMLVCGGANFDSQFFGTYPSGMSGRGSQGGNIATADLIIAAPGATGTKAFTLSSASQNTGISIALKPPSSGTTYTDTGGAVSVFTGSGADVATLVDTGLGQLAGIGSGADAATFDDAGSGVSGFTGSGADAATLLDTGGAVSALTGSGADAAILLDTGLGQLAGIGSGADAPEFVDSGSGLLGAVGSGADAPEYADTGTAVLGASGSGDDANAYVDTGGALAGLFGGGADVLVMVDVGGGVLVAVGSGADVGPSPPVDAPLEADPYYYDRAGSSGPRAGATLLSGPSQTSGTGAIAGSTPLPGPNQGSSTGGVAGSTIQAGPNQSSPTGSISGSAVLPVDTRYDT